MEMTDLRTIDRGLFFCRLSMTRKTGVNKIVVSRVRIPQQNSSGQKVGKINAANKKTVEGMSVRASRAEPTTPEEKIIMSVQA